MASRGRIKPSRSVSVLSMIVGVGMLMAFLGSGLASGGFGLVWLIAVLGIVGVHAANVLSDKGVVLHEVDILDAGPDRRVARSTEERLRELERLREADAITYEEYETGRRRILDNI